MIHLVKLPNTLLSTELLRRAVEVIGVPIHAFEDKPIERTFNGTAMAGLCSWGFVMVKDNTLFRVDSHELEEHLTGENFTFYGELTTPPKVEFGFTKAGDMQEYCEKMFTRYL